MINFLQTPLNFIMRRVESMTAIGDPTRIAQTIGKIPNKEIQKFNESYLKSLEKDCFDAKAIAEKKEQLTKEIKNYEMPLLIKIQLLQDIKQIESTKCFLNFYENIGTIFNNYFIENRKRISPRLYKELEKDEIMPLFSALKVFTKKTTDPRILEIEKELKKLGLKNIALGNNFEDAQAAFNAIKKVHLKNDKLTQNFVISDIQLDGYFGEAFQYGDDSLVQISSSKYRNAVNKFFNEKAEKISKSFKFWCLAWGQKKEKIIQILRGEFRPATGIEFDTLHEHGHINSSTEVLNNLIELTIPEKRTIRKMTQYHPDSEFTSEAFPELYGKTRLFGSEKLTPDESKLFVRLGGKL